MFRSSIMVLNCTAITLLMKRIKIFYWIITFLFAGFMIWTAIPDIMKSEKSMMVYKSLGYPEYLIGFIGVAKLLGSIAILLPFRGLRSLKEWAYAGLFIDLVGATFSALTVFGFMTPMLIMLIPFGLGITSYILFRTLIRSSKTDPGVISSPR
jgi:hypothetical protein